MPENDIHIENQSNQCLSLLSMMLSNGQIKDQTPETLRLSIKDILFMYPLLNDDNAEKIAKRFEAKHSVSQTFGATVISELYHKPWLKDKKKIIEEDNRTMYYWDRYHRYLMKKSEYSNQVLSVLDEKTDQIVDLLRDPESNGEWSRRGLVIGSVQSGKTANYTGVICKAADIGYGLIVVISGTSNLLRTQTQERIEEGFIGRYKNPLSTTDDSRVGVGKDNEATVMRTPISLTSRKADFKKEQATGIADNIEPDNINEPLILVIKKNPSILRNLIQWSKNSDFKDRPLLIIDDEADYASINTKFDKNQVSKINEQIRKLLQVFSRNCFIGYTATPFANIFIDPDTDDEMTGADLFPKDFITLIDPPSNYIGPTTLFPESSIEDDDQASVIFKSNEDKGIREIKDNLSLLPVSHNIEFDVGLPESLKTAIRYFILTIAVRKARDVDFKYYTMMVNASRFINVHKKLNSLIGAELQTIKDSIRQHYRFNLEQALQHYEMKRLYEIWKEELPSSGVTWNQIQGLLYESVSSIVLRIVNKNGSLDYKKNECMIAIGGFSLSRGLTLEGLTVSYFLRNSKMYDTLMQMGRWFGYRPGYEDLCRVWMPLEVIGDYQYIGMAIKELNEELHFMETEKKTPLEFGLKVRNSPGALVVTSASKMGSARDVRLNFTDTFQDTYVYDRNKEVLQSNTDALRIFGQKINSEKACKVKISPQPGAFLLKDVSVEHVKEFMNGYKAPIRNMDSHPKTIVKYIESRMPLGELIKWDILFCSNLPNDKLITNDELLGIPIVCLTRTIGKKSDDDILYLSNNGRVAGKDWEKFGLSPDEIEKANIICIDPKISIDKAYRKVRKNPLLMVYMIQVMDNGNPYSEFVEPVVGWGISFPVSNDKSATNFVGNTIFLRQLKLKDYDENFD